MGTAAGGAKISWSTAYTHTLLPVYTHVSYATHSHRSMCCGQNTHYGRNTKIKKTKINQIARVAELKQNTRTRWEIYNFRKFSTFEYWNWKGPSVKAEHFGHIFWINPDLTTIRFSLTLTLWADTQFKFANYVFVL